MSVPNLDEPDDDDTKFKDINKFYGIYNNAHKSVFHLFACILMYTNPYSTYFRL